MTMFCIRLRRREMLVSRQRLRHLHHYHIKGNPVDNGSTNKDRSAQKSTLSKPRYRSHIIHNHGLPAVSGASEDNNVQHQQLRRSNINRDVFYVSGSSNTAYCSTDIDHTLTTFSYITYDRDYFCERQKSSTIQDRNLRHTME